MKSLHQKTYTTTLVMDPDFTMRCRH